MSQSFQQLQEYLGDPHRAETRTMWESLVSSELGPADRAHMNAMAPAVTSYLAGQIDRSQYEAEMAKLTVPQP